MAAHKSMADKVDLQVQVAGPNAQRQIQQINAMVQAGADAISAAISEAGAPPCCMLGSQGPAEQG